LLPAERACPTATIAPAAGAASGVSATMFDHYKRHRQSCEVAPICGITSSHFNGASTAGKAKQPISRQMKQLFMVSNRQVPQHVKCHVTAVCTGVVQGLVVLFSLVPFLNPAVLGTTESQLQQLGVFTDMAVVLLMQQASPSRH
jgi:hypothetical protein